MQTAGRSLYVLFVLALLLGALLTVTRAWALGDEPRTSETVTQYLTPEILQSMFPGADRIGDVTGTPPAAAVYKAGQLVGYIFSTWDVTRSRGFADRPLVLLVGLSLSGHITGAKLVHHAEAIGILGLRDEDFLHFADQFTGYDIRNSVDVVRPTTPSSGQTPSQDHPAGKVDAIARATTSSVMMSDAVVRGARIVARSRHIYPSDARSGRIETERFEPASWRTLEASGAITHLHIAEADVVARLRERGAVRIGNEVLSAGTQGTFLDLYVALVTPAAIGINLLGRTWYATYTYGHAVGGGERQMLLLAGNGRFSFLGRGWEQTDTIGPIELEQGEKTIRLSTKDVTTLPFLHADGAPDLTERALVFLSDDRGLDPAKPWQIRLLIAGEAADGKPVFVDFTLPYRLPDSFLLNAPVNGAAPEDAAESTSLPWLAIWRGRYVKIAVLCVALTALAAILFLQAPISRRPRLHRWIRVGFLTWTLVWLGWYAGAQLTVVLVITSIHSLVSDFRWDYLLADPLITILFGFTVVSMFVWGRGAFCGWLCPFGALQELCNKAGRSLGIRQMKIPSRLQDRLVAGKYLLFLVLLGVSFLSWDLAMAGTEIEPFKAAIILRFMTEWPMVLYALAMIAASLFVERFYCRLVCPLGGGLAILGKLRLFNPLKRHSECGSRCRVCETVCPVGAIRRNGQINMNECFFCLDCQVTYYDDHTCPPMVWRRKLLTGQPTTPVRVRRTG